MKTYLAGPINGCNDSEAKYWRSVATALLGDVLDPMARDYRDREDGNVAEIVDGDKADIVSCDAVLAFCPKPSVGTSMEVLFAWERRITVVVVVPTGAPVSPWLRYHSSAVVATVEDGARLIQSAAVLSVRGVRLDPRTWRPYSA